MQIEDLFIGVGAAVEMLMEGVAPGEAPSDAQVFHAVSAGMRIVAERLERERAATVGELQAQVQAMQERLDALESMAESREAARDAAYQAAERERDARAAEAEEARERRFVAFLETLNERHASATVDVHAMPVQGPAPGPRVLSTIARLVASGAKPAAIRRWLTASGWTRKSQRSALLRGAAAELAACEPQALREVIAVVTSDVVWPDLIDTLAALEIAETPEEATGDVVDLAGARRAARRRPY